MMRTAFVIAAAYAAGLAVMAHLAPAAIERADIGVSDALSGQADDKARAALKGPALAGLGVAVLAGLVASRVLGRP
jgi:hypothetical protein